MTDLVPTYANCCDCSRLCRGSKQVPRSSARQSADDIAQGRTIAAWVQCDVPNHKRPVCSECKAEGKS